MRKQKRDPKQWAQMFNRRWVELFAALTNKEQRDVMDEPDGGQAQALSRKAGDFADECLAA